MTEYILLFIGAVLLLGILAMVTYYCVVGFDNKYPPIIQPDTTNETNKEEE